MMFDENNHLSYVANKLLSSESYELQQKITGQLQRWFDVFFFYVMLLSIK